MSQKGDISLALLGGTLAIGPAAVKEVPFYETTWWLSAIAILGAFVMVVALANGLLTLRRKLGWGGKDRRQPPS